MKNMNIREKGTESVNSSPSIIANQDVIQNVIGGFERYHLFLFIMLMLSKPVVAFHQIAIVFLAPKIDYTCPGLENAKCPCPNPQFDTSIFKSSIVTEWNLICDRKWLISITQMLFQLGTLLGSVILGMAADRYGRKNPLLGAVVLQVSTGIAAAYMPDFWSFTFTRFLIGFSVGGTMVIGFVITMEFVGTQYREVISALYHAPFNLGHILLSAFGYFFRHYSHFQLVISLPALILLSYFFLIPKSPRWLLAVNRTDEAIQVLECIAKVNNRPTENIRSYVESYQRSIEQNQLRKGNITDLFRTPNLRKNILAMSFNWLTCSYCFYGVSQYVGQLSGNIFANVAASATITLMGTFLSIPLMKVIGRKSILIIFNFICGVCLIILCFIPAGVGSVTCACIGMVSSFIVFVVVYLYCSEMFPTVVRNAALGFSSMMARVGSMIAPFVVGLGDVAVWMPPLGFAIAPLIATAVCLVLPETKGCKLMTTIEEGEQFGRKKV